MKPLFGAATQMPWRKVFIGVAVLLLLLLAFAAFFIATFDANSHKARLTSLVKEKTGREFSIPGGVRLKLFPSVRLELDRAILNENNTSAPFATIEAVKLSLRPWPLLKSQVMLDQVEIGNFNVALKRFADGTTNFDDLISKDESPSTLQFDLASLTIKNGTLQFDDALAQRKTQISNLQLTGGRLAENVAAPIRAQFLLANDNPAVSLQTQLNAELTFDLKRKRYQLNRTQVKAQGEGSGMKPLAIGLEANIDGDLGAGSVMLQGVKVNVDGQSGAQTAHAQLATPKVVSAKSNLSIEQLGAQLKLEDATRKISVNVSLPSLVNTNDKIDAPNFKIDFALAQESLRSTGALIGAINVDLAQQRVALPAMNFSSKTLRNRMTIDANGSGPLTLNLQTGEFDGTQLNGDWRMQNGQEQLSGKWRAPISANITDGRFVVEAIQADWSGRFMGAQMNGKVSVPLQGKWRDAHAMIPSIDLQSNIKWPDSGLEANIRADLETSPHSDQVAAKGVTIKANGYNPSGKWQADLASPVKMDFAKQLAELANLSGNVSWLPVNKNAKPFKLKLNGTGNVDLAREKARFNLKAGLGQSKFNGAFGISGWADPTYRIDASLDQLDLDQYFPADKSNAAKPRQKKTAPISFDLTFLKTLKIDGQIKIGVLKSTGTTARNVRIEMESSKLEKSKP